MKRSRRSQVAVWAVICLTAELALAQATPPPAGLGPPSASGSEGGVVGAPIDATTLSKLPKLIKPAEAAYPKEAEAQGIQADVLLLLDINAEGKVDAVGISEPADPPGMGFDEAAAAVAHQFEFEPVELNGKSIAVQVPFRYKFRLKPKVEPAPVPTPQPPPTATPGAAANPAKKAVVNLRGALIERGTRLPLGGVVVTVFREQAAGPVGFEATSDADGNFQFYDLAPGEWKLLIEPPGYYPFRTTEDVRVGEVVTVKYHVEKGTYNPFDVTITGSRPRKEVSRTVLTAAEIEKIPGAFGDPLAVITNFAGVARADPGELIVRGSAPEDSRIFVDGSQVPLIYHFGGLRSVIPTGMLDSIEFYPGNFAAMYGRATGGVVDVRIKQLRPKKIGGYLDVSILDTALYLEAPIGDNAAIAIGARRSYIDVLLNAVVSSDDIDLVTAPRYYDAQLLLNYRPTPKHDLRAFVFGSDDRLKILFSNPADLDPGLSGNEFSISTSFYRSLLTYRYVPSSDFENTIRVSQGRDWLNFRVGQLHAKLNLYSAQVRESARQKLTDGLAMTVGTDVAFSKADLDLRIPLQNSEGNPAESKLDDTASTRVEGKATYSPALYVEAEIEPGQGFLFVPGVRADHFGFSKQAVVQPRFTGRWQFAEQFALKGGVGLFAQDPQFLEVDETFGNPDLEPEQATHYSVGLEYKPRPHLTLDWTGFYKRLANLVSPTDSLSTENGTTQALRYDNNGSGRVYGFELVARHDLHDGFTGWVSYTLSRAERLDSGSRERRLFDFDQTHILTVVASQALPKNWQIGSRFRLVSGNPETPVIGAVYNASRDQYEPTYGAVNTGRTGMFHQLDVRVDKSWIYDSWKLTAYLDIQNIYSRANPEGVEYNFDFSQSKTSRGLPLLPILGVRGDF